MKFLKRMVFISVFVVSNIVWGAEGLIALKSSYSAQATMDKFELIAKNRGLTIFARINHAAGAAKVGKTLRATEVIIFGNPKGGTPLMECAQTVGIDLPLKVLVWQDEQGQVWLGYNDLSWIAKRHNMLACPAVSVLNSALESLAQATVRTTTE